MEILDIPGAEPGTWRQPEEILEKGYSLNVGNAVSEGFDIFKEELWGFVGYTVVAVLILFAASFIPLAGLILTGPLYAGFFIMSHQVKTGQSRDFGMFFKGFDRFVPLMLYSVISSLFIVIGVFLLIIPGLYLAVAYLVGVPFVLFYHTRGFWDAMEFCRKAVTKDWWSFLGLAVINLLIIIAGSLALGIGVLFALPLVQCILYAAFRQMALARDGAEDAVRF